MSYPKHLLPAVVLATLVGVGALVPRALDPVVTVVRTTTYEKMEGEGYWSDSRHLFFPADDTALQQWLKAQPGVVDSSVERDPRAGTITVKYTQEGYHPEPDLWGEMWNLGYGPGVSTTTTLRVGRGTTMDHWYEYVLPVARELPLFAAYLAGLIASLVYLRRCPRVAVPGLLALGGMTLVHATMIVVWMALHTTGPHSWNYATYLIVLYTVLITANTLEALLLGLLVVAIFRGRPLPAPAPLRDSPQPPEAN
jgi:hypothetical protein